MKKRVLIEGKQKKLEAELLHAMNGADGRGYTGFVGSKGSLFDDPKVKKAKKKYDDFLDKFLDKVK
jgi:hypothetical protein